MNRKVIAAAFFTLSTIACALIKQKANRQYLNEKAAEIVQDEKCQDDILAYNAAKEAISTRDAVLKREKSELKTLFDAWKKENRIEQRKKELYFAEDQAIREFKDTFGYDEAILDLEQKKQESIDAFKTSIDFDEKLDELKEAITDAEKKWKEQESLFASTDDSLSEVASKLKHAAEDAKDATIKAAKEKISELEKKLEAEENVWDKKIQKTRREYEEKINSEKNRLSAKTKKALSGIDEEVDLAYKDLTHQIQEKRTDEEFDAVTFYEDNRKLVKTHDDIDSLKAYDIFQNTPLPERLAWWFTEHKWPKWSVVGGGIIPVVAIDLLIFDYCKFLTSIVKAM